MLWPPFPAREDQRTNCPLFKKFSSGFANLAFCNCRAWDSRAAGDKDTKGLRSDEASLSFLATAPGDLSNSSRREGIAIRRAKAVVQSISEWAVSETHFMKPETCQRDSKSAVVWRARSRGTPKPDEKAALIWPGGMPSSRQHQM